MRYFKKENGEPYADKREGLPIRKMLRKLDKSNKLSEITGCYTEPKKANNDWYFKR